MLETFSAKYFKSLYECELELGRVNVFVGANGSGKSNFLEAIGVLGAAASGRVDDESLLRRGVRAGVPGLYKSSFRAKNTRMDLRLEARSAHAQYSVSLLNPINRPEPAWSFKHENLQERGEKLFGRSPASKAEEARNKHRGLAALKLVEMKPESPAAQLLEALADYAIFTPYTNVLRGLIPDTQNREPVGLTGGRLAEAVLDLIREAKKDEDLRSKLRKLGDLIDWAEKFSVGSATDDILLSSSVPTLAKILYFEDRYMKSGRKRFTAYDASEGSLFVLFTAVLLLHLRSPRILSIDNFDHGLNPRLARKLTEYVCDWVLSGPENKQVFLTSHNPLVLDGLALENDEVRLFSVARSRQGLTTIRPVKISLDKLRTEGKQDWTVSRLWINGELGGVPNL